MNDYSEISLYQHIANLFPICRSILGPGTRQTLGYFEEFFPEMQRVIFSSGESIYDWVVPLEWSITDGYIEDSDGFRYAEFSKNNLHVVGYSCPVDILLPLSELNKHLHSLEEQPDRIPYVTSYYSSNWGFCLSDRVRQGLPEGTFRAFIDSRHYSGELHISHCILPGKSRREIMFSSYVCHPSMANNELSGPVIVGALIDYVKKKYPKRKWTYRFVLQPESIGSIAYLSEYLNHLKKNLLVGFNLSCVGDEGPYSYIQTPDADKFVDRVLASVLVGKSSQKVYSFLERGSDERQYSAPGVDLNIATFTRSKFGTYPEYHTDADNLEYVTNEGLSGSLNAMISIIDALETCYRPLLMTTCEPQLGKRNLYPTISHIGNTSHPAQARSDIIGFSNGENTIFDICLKTGIPLKETVHEVSILKKAGLIRDKDDNEYSGKIKQFLLSLKNKVPSWIGRRRLGNL